jgi:hypothetical protein
MDESDRNDSSCDKCIIVWDRWGILGRLRLGAPLYILVLVLVVGRMRNDFTWIGHRQTRIDARVMQMICLLLFLGGIFNLDSKSYSIQFQLSCHPSVKKLHHHIYHHVQCIVRLLICTDPTVRSSQRFQTLFSPKPRDARYRWRLPVKRMTSLQTQGFSPSWRKHYITKQVRISSTPEKSYHVKFLPLSHQTQNALWERYIPQPSTYNCDNWHNPSLDLFISNLNHKRYSKQ